MSKFGSGVNISKRCFRESFQFPVYFVPSVFHKVFPIHMAKGLNSMRAKAYKCDCLIEIRDARIPVSSYNKQFEQHVRSHHNRLLLINKIDLADASTTKALLKEQQMSANTHVLFTNNKSGTRQGAQSIKKVMSLLRGMATEELNLKRLYKQQQHEDDDQDDHQDDLGGIIEEDEEKAFRTLIYGLPNVGKSSFINAARQKGTKGRGKKPTPVGKTPGVTKSVLRNIIINDSPKMMIIDTPGIVPPNLNDPMVGIKLALVGTFPDDKIGMEVMADFLLYTLNKQNNYSYLQLCGLSEPSDDFDHVITSLGRKQGLIIGGAPDYRLASLNLISKFRDGTFGKITLDQINSE